MKIEVNKKFTSNKLALLIWFIGVGLMVIGLIMWIQDQTNNTAVLIGPVIGFGLTIVASVMTKQNSIIKFRK